MYRLPFLLSLRFKRQLSAYVPLHYWFDTLHARGWHCAFVRDSAATPTTHLCPRELIGEL